MICVRICYYFKLLNGVRRLICGCLAFTISGFLSPNLFALDQHEKLWLAINTQKNFSDSEKWFYTFYSQLRLIKDSHPWQTTLFEGGVGYQFLPDHSLWLGYRWTGHNPNNGFHHANRLIQQYAAILFCNKSVTLASRMRLEEEKRSDKNPIAWQIRERLALELKYFFYNRINPYFWDEPFFQLNKTEFTPNRLISQNRLLIGFNYYLSKVQWLEIGYMNQYIWKRPPLDQNQMNHILSLAYYF